MRALMRTRSDVDPCRIVVPASLGTTGLGIVQCEDLDNELLVLSYCCDPKGSMITLREDQWRCNGCRKVVAEHTLGIFRIYAEKEDSVSEWVTHHIVNNRLKDWIVTWTGIDLEEFGATVEYSFITA